MPRTFHCPKCGGTKSFVETPTSLIDRLWPKEKCLDCVVKAQSTVPQTIDVSGNEQTTLLKIASQYLIGRKIVFSDGTADTVTDAYLRPESRMAMTICTSEGRLKTLYLPTHIELIPLQEWENGQK